MFFCYRNFCFCLSTSSVWLVDVVFQSKLDSLPVEETVSAEAWQPSIEDEDNDESPSEPLTVTLPTTDPGLTVALFV